MDTRLLLAVVAAALSVAFSQRVVVLQPRPDCPNPVACFVNPCDGQSCPRFDDAECRPGYCGGECRADFFRGTRNVTRNCKKDRAATSCAQKRCSDKRVCEEEELPCPRNRPREKCPDPPRVSVKCVSIEEPQPPTDCSAVLCRPRSECVVMDTSAGPRARCLRQAPRDCEELTCDEGMRCVERPRGGGDVVVPLCVAAQTQPRPRNCTQVTCREGMVCMLRANRARCVDLPPRRTCAELRCMSGYECQERGREDDRRAQCVETAPPEEARSCEELDCPRGFQCILREDSSQLVPACVPRRCPIPRRPRTCRELDCGENRSCVVDRDGREQIARCCPVTGGNRTRPDGDRDRNRTRPDGDRDRNRTCPDGDRDRNRTRPDGGREGNRMRQEEDRDSDRTRPECDRDRNQTRPDGGRGGNRTRPDGGRDRDHTSPDGRREGTCPDGNDSGERSEGRPQQRRRPISCRELTCLCEGFECRERQDRNGMTIAFCDLVDDPNLRPQDRPTRPPRPATSCDDLDCGDYSCEIRDIEGESAAVCVRRRTLDQPDGGNEPTRERPSESTSGRPTNELPSEGPSQRHDGNRRN